MTVQNITQTSKINVFPNHKQQLHDCSHFPKSIYHQKIKQYGWSPSIKEGIRCLDQTVLQDIKKDRGNDWCTETSVEYDEDGRRNQYNNYGDKGNNSKDKHQQLDYKHYQYPRNIGGLVICNLEQHGGLSISNSKNVSWQIRCI